MKTLVDLSKSIEYRAYLQKIIQVEFIAVKNNLIQAFQNHPITKEINAGPDAENTSGTLGGYGNLFSFIGFEKSDKPTQIIELMLEEIEMGNILIKKNGQFNVVVKYPKPRDIFAVTPMPWAEGRSWAKGIESGISGLGKYLNKDFSSSRSGGGIQSKSKQKNGKFRNTTYISKLIFDFEQDILRINKMIIK